jgi:hypothetical protein
MSGDAGNVCSYTRQGANSMYVTTATPAACHVDVGTTYYLNFADVDLSGNALCFSSRANTCTTSQIAYTLYSSGSR